MKTLILFIMLQFTLPSLPYKYEALNPTMSEETLRYHHDKHHRTYVDNLNHLIKNSEFKDSELADIIRHSKGAIFNNAAQVWNHTFFFEQFGNPTPIKGKLAEEIVRHWGSIEQFKEAFLSASISQFGSGWVWLVCDRNGELNIITESNAGNPLTQNYTPLLTFDLWEHAYYIDYRNRKSDYINSLWNILNWKIIEDRYIYFFDF